MTLFCKDWHSLHTIPFISLATPQGAPLRDSPRGATKQFYPHGPAPQGHRVHPPHPIQSGGTLILSGLELPSTLNSICSWSGDLGLTGVLPCYNSWRPAILSTAGHTAKHKAQQSRAMTIKITRPEIRPAARVICASRRLLCSDPSCHDAPRPGRGGPAEAARPRRPGRGGPFWPSSGAGSRVFTCHCQLPVEVTATVRAYCDNPMEFGGRWPGDDGAPGPGPRRAGLGRAPSATGTAARTLPSQQSRSLGRELELEALARLKTVTANYAALAGRRRRPAPAPGHIAGPGTGTPSRPAAARMAGGLV